MSVRRYDSYRDSGVEWLGEVPSHWAVPKLKQLATFIGGGTPSRDKPEFWNGEIPWVSPKDMKSETLSDSEERLTDLGLAASSANLVRPGAVLMVVRSGILRHTIPVAVSLVPVALNQDMKAIFFDSGRCLPGFFLRWVQGFNTALINVVCKQGATVESIEHDYLCEVQFPLPPLSEQAAIATFLDRETAKIDALVEEQRRLIALLAEKRQAVISHAVTKGLDPTVPMKDSGVEWLGEVPAHWNVAPVGYRYEVQLGRMLNEERSSGDFPRPYLRVADVQWNMINVDDLPLMDFPPAAQERYRLRAGDLLVNEGGSYVGRSAIWRGEIEECYYQKALHRLRPVFPVRDTVEFFYYVMEDAAKRGVFVHGGNQTTIDHLTADQLKGYRFAFPPISEQVPIAEFVSKEISKLDGLSAEAQSATTLLQERRAALISAAVTGQIDVRGLVPVVEEAA